MNRHETQSPTDTQDHDSIPSNNNSDHWNPTKFRMEMRQQAVAASFVEHDDSMTVDLLTTLCHALVTTNQEIWERCKPFHCATINSANSQEPDSFIFYRVGYWNVRAWTPTNSNNNSMRIEAVAELTKNSFEIPLSLPPRLECRFVHLRTEGNDIMPNYELLLKRSMLLIDEVLPGFLLEFKAFLETLQIALGKVDDWLIQPNENALFLRNQFKVAIAYSGDSLRQVGARYSSWEIGKEMLLISECSRCGSRFQDHLQNEQNGWVFCGGDKQPGCFPLPAYKTSLGRYECPCTGAVNFNFCIEIPSERSRFIKFLEFVRHNEVATG